MAWSKSTRIKVMIAIDTAFFLLELICGFLAHSLALTADAFHMVCCAIPFHVARIQSWRCQESNHVMLTVCS